MMTVKDVSRLCGVSVRTLQYYDKIGLLSPSGHSRAGYRLYDDTALEKLGQILLFRELEFPLKDIKKILSSPDFDKNKAVEQQIELLTMKKQHIENLISFARTISMTGVNYMDFKAFDTSKINEYAKQAKEQWGATRRYREFEEKNKNKPPQQVKEQGAEIIAICAGFGRLKEKMPHSQFVMHNDYEVLSYLMSVVEWPVFQTNYTLHTRPALDSKIDIPVTDKEANVTYYCLCKKSSHNKISKLIDRL